jgi:hypothetical protein
MMMSALHVPEQNLSRRNHNKMCHEREQLLPILHEPSGLIPSFFPVTKADLNAMDANQLNQLLTFYNLPNSLDMREKHLIIAQFIGID